MSNGFEEHIRFQRIDIPNPNKSLQNPKNRRQQAITNTTVITIFLVKFLFEFESNFEHFCIHIQFYVWLKNQLNVVIAIE